MHMSKSRIYDQLISEYGEKFTYFPFEYVIPVYPLISEYGEKFTKA